MSDSKSTDELHDKIRDPFYAVAHMSTGTAPDGGDDFLITKKAFNKYTEGLLQLFDQKLAKRVEEAWIDSAWEEMHMMPDHGSDSVRRYIDDRKKKIEAMQKKHRTTTYKLRHAATLNNQTKENK